MQLPPRVGVAVFLWRGDEFLVAKRGRITACGMGTWGPPGGAVEYGEHWIEAGIREVREETSLVITTAPTLRRMTNDVCYCGEHWITLWLDAYQFAGRPRITDECTEYLWCRMDNLPTPLFQPQWDNLLAQER